MHQTNTDPDELDRPEWNDLVSNYDKHDIGEAYFKGLLHQMGLHVENWGIDMRHHDENLIFDNKMDLRLWEPLDGQERTPEWPDEPLVESISQEWDLGVETVQKEWELRGVADVKTKSSPSWFGRFNVRHLAHYAEWADRYDHPVFVYMTMVDETTEEVGEEEFIVEIPTDWNWQLLCDYYDDDSTDLTYGDIKDITRECAIVDRTFRAPDGNLVIETDESEWQSLDYITKEVL